MIKSKAWLWIELVLLSCITILALTGCGGGSPSTATDGGGPAVTQESGTARFHVDVKTGKVTVTSLQKAGSRAVFSGAAVGFESSVLVDEAGATGRKALSVSLVNNRNEAIGQMPDGLPTSMKVLFGGFTNVGAWSDLRPRVAVNTLAGTGAAGSADGAAGSATFNAPSGVAADNTGALYVADTIGNRIRKIAGGAVSTLAGSGAAGGSDGLGAAATFNAPYGLAVNPVDGALIVTDYTGHRVRRVGRDGRVSTIAGTGVAGDANGTGTGATFRNPMGVVVDSSGAIYVSEYTGHRLRKIALTGGDPTVASSYTVSALAGSGSAGYADGVGAGALFNQPSGIAIGGPGLLYVADTSNHRIRLVRDSGEVVTIAGTGVAGFTDGTGATATFNAPYGIVQVGSVLVVSDAGGRVLRQLRLRGGGSAAVSSPSGWLVQTLAGLGGVAGDVGGSGTAARFNSPRLLAADGSGQVYIAERGVHKIKGLRPTNGFFPVGEATGSAPSEPVQLANADGVIPGSALPYIVYEGALGGQETTEAKSWVFEVPDGVTAFEFTVTVEANTAVWSPPESVSNTGGTGGGSPRVQVRMLAGAANGSFGYLDGLAVQARFNRINGVAVDAAGNLYVADAVNHAVRRVSAEGAVSTVAGDVGIGTDGSNDGFGNEARFSSPSGVAVTPAGDILYVTDNTNQTVRRIDLMGGDPQDPGSWVVSTIAGEAGTAGSDNGTGDAARFTGPYGIALDKGGLLYVTEFSGNRVRRLQYKGGDPTQAASWQVSLVAGDTGGSAGSTDAAGSSARFSQPAGIAADRAGNLYVADASNHRIRKITPDGAVTTLAGSSSGYIDGSGAAVNFANPAGVTVGPSGAIFVADTGNRRIRRVSATGAVSTVAGTGTSGAADGAGNAAQFAGPAALVVDASGNLYVADGLSGERIRLVQRVIAAGER
ncbi:MAG: hypothetical protein IT210_02395 [Armatimonadetes bacterium]|nr:hypothetical protein [Armatimonadota bacterium]